MEPHVLEERLWKRSVITSDGCFEWQGSKFKRGYGQLHVEGKSWRLHRLAYLVFIGPIPDGLELDHVCRNKLCWNPEHLEPVTHAENMRRTRDLGLWSAKREVCYQGHPFTPENTYTRRNGARWCRICAQAREKKRVRVRDRRRHASM